MEQLFFVLLFLTAYPYIIFPLFVFTWAKLTGKDWEQNEIRPKVSMIIAVYNEERVISEKIDNTLSQYYPGNLLEILIVSDGSTDMTNEIVSSYKDPRIVFKPFAERKGKTSCLNLAVLEAKGDVLVFTDANSMFPPDALVKMVRNFANEQIGLVTGWTKYRNAGENAESVGLYSRFEMVTKHAESLISSCVGADGAIFALRKDLYQPLNDYDINDFVIPLKVIGQNKRVVLDPEVYCIEQPGDDESKEFRRQVRITNRTLGALWRNVHFFDPIKYGSFTFFLISHKVTRFMLPFFSIALIIITLLIVERSLFYCLVLIAQLALIAIGIGYKYKVINGRMPKLCSFLLMTIAAQFIGWIRWSLGKSDTIWKPER